MAMRAIPTVIAATLSLILCSCEVNRYEIEMTPEGQQIKRTLRHTSRGGVRAAGAKAGEEAKRLAKAYATSDPSKGTFGGSFRGALPGGVGGWGRYHCYPSGLGSCRLYVERFRGATDLVAEMDRRRRSADNLADLLIAWFDNEMGKDEQYKRLRAWLDGDLRRDAANVLLQLWQAEVAYGEDGEDGLRTGLVRIGAYLCERGYFSPEQAPALLRAATGGDATGGKAGAVLRRFLATRMGVGKDDPVPESLAFLSNKESVQQSFKRFVKTTPQYRKALARRQQEEASVSQGPEGAVTDAIKALLKEKDLEWIAGKFFSDYDTVRVTLTTGTEPLGNGKWNGETHQVTWTGKLELRSEKPIAPPKVCYAVWVTPDEAFQKARFGKVILDEDKLARYCLWRGGLTAAEATQWDAFLASLRPANLSEKLPALHERLKAQQEGDAESYLLEGLRLIGEALEMPPWKAAEGHTFRLGLPGGIRGEVTIVPSRSE
jgi:hypothetical protein